MRPDARATRWAAIPAAALIAAGCAGVIPQGLRDSVDRGVSFADLRANPETYNGRRVALAGEILKTSPLGQVSEVEVLQYPLRYDDAPDLSAPAGGRLLVRHAGFLDPAVYAAGRRITVVGTVQGSVERPVGEVPYRYPVIGVEFVHLWPRYDVVYGPDPFFYPYPYYPWPYYGYPFGPYRPYLWGSPYGW
ncbi:MAG TPA: Slp family lipoprotein [Candidatus Methylomirabilis sp.]|jgi:outer membrane lipoprotein